MQELINNEAFLNCSDVALQRLIQLDIVQTLHATSHYNFPQNFLKLLFFLSLQPIKIS